MTKLLIILLSLTLLGCSEPIGKITNLSHGKVKGIDVSHHNVLTNSDWATLKSRNIEFAYIKVSEGGSYKDPMRYKHYCRALKHDIYPGTYHFFRDNVSAEKQYRNYESAISNMAWYVLPCIDYEKAGFKKDFKTRLKVLKELNDLFFKRGGVYPIIYCDLIQYTQIKAFFPKNQFWISASSPDLGIGIIKQYIGKINGKTIDFNVCNIEDILFSD